MIPRAVLFVLLTLSIKLPERPLPPTPAPSDSLIGYTHVKPLTWAKLKAIYREQRK